mgnify:CR=1 FL=1|jgi:hypothetical protein
MMNYKPLKPLTLSRHKTAKSAVKINGTYQNVNKLISESPLELWNIVNHPSKYKRQVIGKPEFLKLKRIIEDKYPELYKKHSQKQAIKYQKKKLLKDMQNRNVCQMSVSFLVNLDCSLRCLEIK